MNDFITSVEQEYLIHKASCEEFAVSLGEMGYRPVTVLYNALAEKIASIDHQKIHSAAINDGDWVRRSNQAQRIFERKRASCRHRLDAIRTAGIAALGGLDAVTSSRLSLIRVMLGLFDRHADFSRLTEDEKAAINACRACTEKAGDIGFAGYSYFPRSGSIRSDDNREIAVLACHGYDRDEHGTMLAASREAISLVERAMPAPPDADWARDAEALIRQVR